MKYPDPQISIDRLDFSVFVADEYTAFPYKILYSKSSEGRKSRGDKEKSYTDLDVQI